MTDTTNIIIPSSPADRKKLKMMISEMTHCMSRIELENESKRDLAKVIHEEFQIPKKIINRLASTMYKRNYEDVQAENDDFQTLYETVMGSSSNPSDVDAALDELEDTDGFEDSTPGEAQ